MDLILADAEVQLIVPKQQRPRHNNASTRRRFSTTGSDVPDVGYAETEKAAVWFFCIYNVC